MRLPVIILCVLLVAAAAGMALLTRPEAAAAPPVCKQVLSDPDPLESVTFDAVCNGYPITITITQTSNGGCCNAATFDISVSAGIFPVLSGRTADLMLLSATTCYGGATDSSMINPPGGIIGGSGGEATFGGNPGDPGAFERALTECNCAITFTVVFVENAVASPFYIPLTRDGERPITFTVFCGGDGC